MNPEFLPFFAEAKLPDATAADQARRRQDSLTKPPGALGELESIVVRLAALQGQSRPRLDRVQISIYAADHGVAEENVSAFPQAVTAEMIRNFARGGAAITVLARSLGATLEVVNLGTAVDCGELAGVRRCLLGPGTSNFTRQAAMNDEQCVAAMNAGSDSVRRAAARSMNLFIGGEMGIGNSTAAAALACALLGVEPALMTGPGTGLDTEGVQHKVQVVERGLVLHAPYLKEPTAALCRLGGFEIAALTGAFLTCAQIGVPALIDGFIASVSALVAERVCPGASRWWLFAHRSAEPGHAHVLNALKAKPLLDLGMRLGEGSGAAIAVPMLRLACDLHNGMASFDEAGVSTKIP